MLLFFIILSIIQLSFVEHVLFSRYCFIRKGKAYLFLLSSQFSQGDGKVNTDVHRVGSDIR